MNRRKFIQNSGLAMANFAIAPSFLQRAFALDQVGDWRSAKKILIAIFQRGAADGLSMVIPHGEKALYRERPELAPGRPLSGNAETALELNEFFGLHPGLSAFKPIYNERRMAIVHAVGSHDGTRSHFDAQDYMESATPGNKGTREGWLNRLVLAQKINQPSPFRAVSFTASLPRSLMGPAATVTMTNLGEFGVRAGAQSQAMAAEFETLYGKSSNDLLLKAGQDSFSAVKLLEKANPKQYQPAAGVEYPSSPFGRSLLQIAQLIKSRVGLEVAFTDYGGWDTHSNQGGARGQLANRLMDFSQAIAALYNDLGDRIEEVVILTMTEFGRTLRPNGAAGTDHGHGSCLFVLGGKVQGGKVYGRWPGLEREQLYQARDLAVTTDFREVFAEIAVRHLGIPAAANLFPGYKVSPSNFAGFLG